MIQRSCIETSFETDGSYGVAEGGAYYTLSDGELIPEDVSPSSENITDTDIEDLFAHMWSESMGIDIDETGRMEDEYDRLGELMEHVAALTCIPGGNKLLLDGGTFTHMFGTGVEHMLTNIRHVRAVPITTAGNVIYLSNIADLHIGKHVLKDGFINPFAEITLISEGKLAKYYDWGRNQTGQAGHITCR